jgi:hypothetical protein
VLKFNRAIVHEEFTMRTSATQASLKLIGANGQISLGKQFAGRQVLVEEQEPGVWLVRTVTVIPDNELWAHGPQASGDIESALGWAETNAPNDTNLDAVLSKIRNDG